MKRNKAQCKCGKMYTENKTIKQCVCYLLPLSPKHNSLHCCCYTHRVHFISFHTIYKKKKKKHINKYIASSHINKNQIIIGIIFKSKSKRAKHINFDSFFFFLSLFDHCYCCSFFVWNNWSLASV